MGDAATHLYTDSPEIFSVIHENEVTYGTNFLQVQVNNDQEFLLQIVKFLF